MAKQPIQKGGKYFEFRNGLGGFSWEGMATKVDPGGNPPNRPRYLGNTRIQGGTICAPPQYVNKGTMVPVTKRLTPAFQDSNNRPPFGTFRTDKWLKHWIGEHNSVGGTRLWWGGAPPLTYVDPDWIAGNGGAYLGFIDTDADPPFQEVAYYPAADSWTPSIEKFNREVYMGDYAKLRKLQLIHPPAGASPADLLSAPADDSIATFPGFRTAVLQEYMGKLYFMLTDPFTFTNGEIWSWDGFQVVLEYSMATPGAAGAAAALYKNQLVFSVAGYGSLIVFDPAGGWTTPTLGGFDSSPFLNSMTQYRDKLFIMDGVDRIYSWNGSVITLEHTITATFTEMGRGSIDAIPALAFCCSTLSDRLYYIWTDSAVTPNLICLGSFDDKSEAAYQWQDLYQYGIYITGMSGYPSTGGNGSCTALAQYRGRLWAAFGNYPTGNSMIWTHSNQFTPYDGWFRCDGANGPGSSFGSGSPFPGQVPIYYFRSI
jgi:hypothetical protein